MDDRFLLLMESSFCNDVRQQRHIAERTARAESQKVEVGLHSTQSESARRRGRVRHRDHICCFVDGAEKSGVEAPAFSGSLIPNVQEKGATLPDYFHPAGRPA